MNDQKTNKEVSKKAGVLLTKEELTKKIKEIFILDEVDENIGDAIYVNSTYNDHLFTFTELSELFVLAKKYKFKFSFLGKNEFRSHTQIMIRLWDSFIIL